jgi:hypothetical protein
MKLGKTLSPLEPQQKVNVIDGLYVNALTGQGIHPARDQQLSGAHISKGAIIHSGISVDQRIAAHVGEEGNGTVLDNTCLMFLSNMSAANTTTSACRWCLLEAWAGR